MTSKPSAKPKILMLAFACEPDEGSEPEVGWKWACTMAECCEVTVVTQSKNRPRIDRWSLEHPDAPGHAVRFYYLELGPVWRALKKQVPGGMYLYYALWQWKLRAHVAALLRNGDFDLIHHVTFASFRMPVFASGRPVVWGPVGGAETAMMPLLAGYGTFLGRQRERFRNFTTRIAGRCVRRWDPSHRTGGIALASTPATARVLERADISCQLMPTIGFEIAPHEANRESQATDAPLRLIFVGRLHLLKGLHLLLQAVATLEPGSVWLTIVGEGPERQRLKKLVDDLELQGRVEFRGFIPRNRLAGIYQEHDVMVAPSLYESGGLSVLEGFSHGLPAIVLDCGGHALSVDETCGWKIPIRPSQAAVVRDLAAAVAAYHSDRATLIRHGANARKKLQRAYAWENKCLDMLAIYQSLIQNRMRVSSAPLPTAPP
ncbi:MAG: glycosyltransferase family 4 protein [Verrucomicrobiota bacterium]